eukprot:SAG22_NODE_99_length_20560_cov_128.669029_26_plen_316_part_00
MRRAAPILLLLSAAPPQKVAVAAAAESAAPAADPPLRPLAAPAMRLYGIISPRFGWGDDPQQSNTTWSAADLQAASQLEMVYGGALDEATARVLTGRTQRVKYKNFGGTAPAEAPATETAHHADIAYYRAGVLGEALTAQQTTLRVAMEPHIPHGGPPLPLGNTSCPFGLRPSTAEGDSTILDPESERGGTVLSYITWVRVGEEYMKVVGVSVAPGAAASGPSAATAAIVTVERGLWVSQPRSHAANVSVLAPIYHSKGGWPEGSSGSIRYALDQSRPWVAEYNAAAFTTPDVLDGAWMSKHSSVLALSIRLRIV